MVQQPPWLLLLLPCCASALPQAISPVPAASLVSLHNLRDLAGTPCRGATAQIKPGLVLRSASPADATPADADELLRCVPDLQILDLRSAADAACDEGPRLLAGRTRHLEMLPKATASKRLTRHVLTDRLRFTFYLLPFRLVRSVPGLRRLSGRVVDRGVRKFLETIELSDVYWWILAEQGDAIRLALSEISEAGAAATPTLIHCAHGKDRTGVLVAVLLHVCGAEVGTIAADYARSDEWGCSPMGQDIMLQAMPERYRERIREWNTPPPGETQSEAVDEAALPDGEAARQPFESAFYWSQFGRWCGADAETMRTVFARVERKWGSMDGYLDAIGFDATQRAKLAAALTCEA